MALPPPARCSEASLVRELKSVVSVAPLPTPPSSPPFRIGATWSREPPVLRRENGRHRDRTSSGRFSDLLDYGFTATMEERLDEVAQGALSWTDLLNEFARRQRQVVPSCQRRAGWYATSQPTGIPCDACGRPMQIRTASRGVHGVLGLTCRPKALRHRESDSG